MVSTDHRNDPLAVVRAIAELCREEGGRALMVGGCVRDRLLGLIPKDYDIEVFGLEPVKLAEILSRRFTFDEVGKQFGVFKLKHIEVDVSVPRFERKTGDRHQDFEVSTNPQASFREAAARRDFTLNAIFEDPLSSEQIDPFGGVEDLRSGRLKHTSAQFTEDPLRVLRAMQFVSRFELRVEASTIALCRSMSMDALPPERLFEEWKKLILRGQRPSLGLQFLRECDWLKYYPELHALVGCPQDPHWHPEGDVWNHTLLAMDAFAQGRTGQEWDDLVVGLAVLCHDMGKPATTVFERGHYRSPGHDKAGEEPTLSFLARITAQKTLIAAVIPLVLTHMRPNDLYENSSGDAAVRRLARAAGRVDLLVRVVEADAAGRSGRSAGDYPVGQWLLQRAEQLKVTDSAPEPIILGRHLIAEGLSPGVAFKRILNDLYEAQLDGVFQTEAEGVAYLSQYLAERNDR